MTTSTSTGALPGEILVRSSPTWKNGVTHDLSFLAHEPMNEWTVVIAFAGDITEIWGAEIVTREGDLYTLTGTAMAAPLSAGDVLDFGFSARCKGDTTVSLVSVNGHLVELPAEDTAEALEIAPSTDPVLEEQKAQSSPPPEEPVSATSLDGEGDTDTSSYFQDNGRVEAEWEIFERFDGGFNTYLTIMNDTGVAQKPWSLLMHTDGFEVSVSWGMQVENLKDGWVRLTGADWGAALQPGQEVTVGFTGLGVEPVEILFGAEVSETLDTNGRPEVTAELFDPFEGGFNTYLTITNDTGADLSPWSVIMELGDFTIKSAWGMTVEDLGNGRVLLTGADWGAALPSGGTITVGFTGLGTAPETFVFHAADATEPTPKDPSEPEEPTAPTPVNDGPFSGADYGEALEHSMQFYYAQYSGDLPDNHPISWRGDSALTDGAEVGRDLTGGWYDAGDHVKFGLPMAYTATVLAWGADVFADGYAAAGALDDVVAHVDWVNDYFLRAYDDRGTADLSDDIFYAQVGDGHLDHAYWGAAEDMDMERPVYALTAEAPGTEVTAETAAAMASGAIVLAASGSHERAEELIARAEKLFAFSEAFQGTYTDAIPEVADFYASWTGYQDEMAWAASWLYKATGDETYLAKAEAYYHAQGVYWSLSWDDKSMGTAMRLAEITGDERYVADLERHFTYWMEDIARTPGTESNDGMGWLDQWGSARYPANTAFLALQYAELLELRGARHRAGEIEAFARDQIDYLLGDNPDGFSFVVGFGDDYALNPHHRNASGTTDVFDAGDNAHTLYGALVGGPDLLGQHDDSRENYIDNEVAIDYNAGLSGALAGLTEMEVLMV
nr:glycoside hydrolase family 9 protein [Roseivivax marinus]